MNDEKPQFTWDIAGIEEGEPKELPLRRELPAITVRPIEGVRIRSLNLQDDDQFTFTSTPLHDEDGYPVGARTDKLRCIKPSEHCRIVVSFSTDEEEKAQKATISIPTKVPLHIPGKDAKWKTHYVRISERTVETCRFFYTTRQFSEQGSLGFQDVLDRLCSFKRAVIWFEGDPGSGKTTYLDQLRKALFKQEDGSSVVCQQQDAPGPSSSSSAVEDDIAEAPKVANNPEWCIVNLDGTVLGEKLDLDELRGEITDQLFDAFKICRFQLGQLGNPSDLTKLKRSIGDHQGQVFLQEPFHLN